MIKVIALIFMFTFGNLLLIKAEISSALIQRQFMNAHVGDGEPLSVLTVPSLLHCAMSCSGTPDCLAFNFMKTSNFQNCYLHNNVANDNNLLPNKNYDYYEVNECYNNNPCWNGGICYKPVNSTHGVTCQCEEKYTGNFCEDAKIAELPETTVNGDFRKVDTETETTILTTTTTTPTTTMTTPTTTMTTPTTTMTTPTTTKTTPTSTMTTSATTSFSFQWPTNAQPGAQSSTTNCSGTINLTDNAKTFTSGNYPSYYENNLNCTWLIHTTTEGTLSITVNNLEVETSANCVADRLSVFNGPSVSSAQIAKLCTNLTNYTLPQTTNNTAVVQFITDANFNFVYSGFNLSYRLIPDGE